MNIAFLTDDEKQNLEINCPYKLHNKKSGTLAHGFYSGNSTLSGDLYLTMRDGQIRKQFQGMESSTYFQSLFTKLVIASDCFIILKTKTAQRNQFISLDSVMKTRTIYFLNLKLKQCKKCMAQQNM